MGAQISLRHLRCFSAVADTGSFTLAAQRLFQTQSSLTATIKQLEELAGLRLFDRTTRRVVLTKDAEWFKVVSDKVLKEFDNAISDLVAVAEGKKGYLKIGAAASMITHVLGPTLVNYRAQYPEISIMMYEESSDKIERGVLEGDMDFGLSSRLNDFPGLDYTPIIADPIGAIFPRDHELASHEGPLKWSDLHGYSYIGLTTDTGIGALLDAEPMIKMVRGEMPFDLASSTASLFALLRLGGAISVLPSLAAHGPGSTNFEFRILEGPRLERKIYLITRNLRSLSPTTQRFLNVLMGSLKDVDGPLGVRLMSDAD